MRLLIDELIQGGVKQNQIIYINFDSFANSHLTQAHNLYEEVRTRMTDLEKYYLLFDETQEVEKWKKQSISFW